MNEQDKIIEEKIKKREKTDITLAYIMIVLLLGLILFIVYLKFIKKEDTTVEEPTEYTAEYITLDTISSSLVTRLNTKYNGINSNYNGNDNSITINYGDINYIVPLINNELEFTIDNDNKELSEDIYKEVVATICTYYEEDRDGCVNAANNLDGTNVLGVRFLNDKVYISITNSVQPTDIIEEKVEENTNTEENTSSEESQDVEENDTDETTETDETIE